MSKILDYIEVTELTGTEQFLFADPGGDPANTINAENLALYVLSLNAYATEGVNIGSTGVHIYAGVVGGVLRFNNISVGSNKLSLGIDGSHNIVIDVDPSHLLLSALGGDIDLSTQITGLLPVAHGGTNSDNATDARTELGAASAGANTDIASLLLDQFGLLMKSLGVGALIIGPDESLSADRKLSIILNDANRALTITGDASVEGINTGDQTIELTGDVTGSGVGSFATSIAENAVTFDKMVQISSQSFIGRTTASTGDPEQLSQSQAKGVLGLDINSTRSYSSQTLAFSTPRTPSATQDTFVVATLNSSALAAQGGAFSIQVDTGGGYVTIASIANNNLTGLTQVFQSPITFIVPANCAYQILQSGTATNTISTIYELSL